MIITVHCTGAGGAAEWQAELLEWSFLRFGQPGELVRLVPGVPQKDSPVHHLTRVHRTDSWNPHPWTDDVSDAYELPAGALQWLLEENLDATILLLESDMAFQAPIDEEVTPGTAIGAPWTDGPTVDGPAPFGLPEAFEPLVAYCVHRSLKLPLVRFPVLIHARDLARMAARWLELTGMIRSEVEVSKRAHLSAQRLAYAIAAAEYGVTHETRDLLGRTDDKDSSSPLISYRIPIVSADGKSIWDPAVYAAWGQIWPELAEPGPGRQFLAFLQEYVTLREATGHLASFRPVRSPGVREARVGDRMLLEVPGQEDEVTLNASAGEIWALCNGDRSLAEIVDDLERRFDVPRSTLGSDVEYTVKDLKHVGALDIEAVHE
ncbi:MAG: PqqD family protein [Pseudomonadota bacterium]